MLTQTFVELADTLVADFDVVELLTLLTTRCVDVLGVSAAGIMLVGIDGDLRVMASSSEAMRVLELFELQAREGPCLDCYQTGQAVSSLDLVAGGARWPRFAAEALGAGFHSVHALPMRLRGSVIGALNLFHQLSDQMAQVDVDAAQALADVATIIIEQAKGIVAERKGLSMEEAFYTLRNHARNHKLRLVDVAGGVIDGSFAASELDAPSTRPT
jgi:transcriptional regulator with GAF, ATPase, and Fis domain